MQCCVHEVSFLMERGGIGGRLHETDPRDTLKVGMPTTSIVPAGQLDSYMNRKSHGTLNSEARDIFKLNGHEIQLEQRRI